MSLKFGQIGLLVCMAADRSITEKKTVLPLFLSAVFYPILFILAGNDDMKFGQIVRLTVE